MFLISLLSAGQYRRADRVHPHRNHRGPAHSFQESRLPLRGHQHKQEATAARSAQLAAIRARGPRRFVQCVDLGCSP